jgi:hypothetical protein
MPPQACGLDLSPCNCFLFSYLKEKLIDKQWATPKELFAEVVVIISEIPSDRISRVFAIWQERSQKCCDMR